MVQFNEVKSVAFIRVGALGDLLVSMAALAEAHEMFPRANVCVFGPKLWLQLIDTKVWPRITKIAVLENKRSAHIYESIHNEWRLISEHQKLSDIFKQFDASINLRVESYRFAWGPFFARVPIRLGTCLWPMKWLYTHWSPWLGKDPILHERDRMLRILEAPRTTLFPIGLTSSNRQQLKRDQTAGNEARVPDKKANKYLVFQPGQKRDSLAYKWQTSSLPKVISSNNEIVKSQFCLEPKKYWLVNPTASRWEKAWSKNKFREFCHKIQVTANSYGRQVVVIGAPNETEWLNFVADSCLRVIQPESLRELAWLVDSAELLVCNTSSVQFFAAASKTPCFTLMGRTFPARWGPLGVHDHFVAGQVPESFRNPDIFLEDFAGYDSLTVDTVFNEFRTWMSTLPSIKTI